MSTAQPGSFAEMALRCCSHAARLLGWKPGEFWSATPAELAVAIREPGDPATNPPTRDLIARMMERDTHE